MGSGSKSELKSGDQTNYVNEGAKVDQGRNHREKLHPVLERCNPTQNLSGMRRTYSHKRLASISESDMSVGSTNILSKSKSHIDLSKKANDMTEEQFEELMAGLRKFSSVPPRARHQRPLRGKATIKAKLLRKKGVDVVLRVSQGFFSIVGGPELEDRLLHIPLLHVVINPVPDQDNVFLLDIDDPDQTDQMPSGVFVIVTDGQARDRWMEALSEMGVRIHGGSDLNSDFRSGLQAVARWDPSRGWNIEPTRSERRLISGAFPLVRWLS